MSWSKEITIWCDCCDEWKQESSTTVANARIGLGWAGWSYIAGVDRCKRCSEENRRAIKSHKEASDG